ncbi:MAG: restriction endonuclease subunit S [Bacteroidaceae bacterium]|nr:restriction endonuclease subunit S [Bacteroidaceae bacterium]
MSIVKFSDVAHRANTKEDRFNTDKIYYVGGEHIDSNELFVRSKGIIKGSTIGPMFYCGFTSGQILFVTRNPHLRKCGIVDFDGICSEKTFVIESKDTTKLSQEYLAIIMQSDEFWNYCEENKSGGVNYFLNWSTLADYEFELPPIQIQEEIAEKVMSAYRLKQSYQKLLTATDEMIKSQFIEMFWGGKYTMKKLRGHIEVLRGVSYKLSDVHEDLSDNTSIVLRSNNIDGGQVNFDDLVYVDSERVSEHQVLNAGDIVMCGSNGSKKLVGKAALLNETPRENTSFGAFCLGIRCKSSIIPEYLATYFQTSLYRDKIEELGSGSNILNIKPDHIYDLEIPIPSLGEQETFVLIVKQADKSKFELRKSIEAIDAVIKNLING